MMTERRCGYSRYRLNGLFHRFLLAALIINALVFAALPVRAESLAEDLQKSLASRVVINIPSRTLILYQWGIPVQISRVAVGRPEKPTPVGDFSVLTKQKNPTWTDPDDPTHIVPAGRYNPLGNRWIGIKSGGYGIHGTTKPSSIGHFASRGCIRMKKPDIEALFDKVQLKTPVTITYNVFQLSTENNTDLYLTLYPDHYRRARALTQQVQAELDENYSDFVVDQAILKQILTKGLYDKPLLIGHRETVAP